MTKQGLQPGSQETLREAELESGVPVGLSCLCPPILGHTEKDLTTLLTVAAIRVGFYIILYIFKVLWLHLTVSQLELAFNTNEGLL